MHCDESSPTDVYAEILVLMLSVAMWVALSAWTLQMPCFARLARPNTDSWIPEEGVVESRIRGVQSSQPALRVLGTLYTSVEAPYPVRSGRCTRLACVLGMDGRVWM